MKKTLIACVALFWAASGFSQYMVENPDVILFRNYYTRPSDAEMEMYKANGVKSLVKYSGTKKQVVAQESTFDTNGKLISVTQYPRFGSFYKTVHTNLMDDGTSDETTYNQKGREIRKETRTYNSDTLITQEHYWRKGELVSRVENDYSNKKLMESRYYTEGNTVPYKVWKYTYYPEGSKKSSSMYKKGKLKLVWNYECKDEGELARKHQDTIAVCKNETVGADGLRTVTTRKYDQKGMPVKEVYVYNRENKILEMHFFNSKDQKTYSYVSNSDGTRTTNTYYKKGVEWLKHENFFNSKQQLLERLGYRNGKITYRSSNEYNNSGKLISSVDSFKNRVRSSTRYAYDEKNLLSTIVTVDSKGEVSYTSKVIYGFQ